MKILCVSHSDNGGNAYFTAEAINRYTSHEATAVRVAQSYLQYPYDLLDPSKDVLLDLCKWADVIHARDGRNFLPVDHSYKPCLITYSGRGYRKGWKKLRARCKERKWLLSVSTVDLTLYDPQVPIWLPNPREDMEHISRHRHKRFTVAHSPTFRDRKGTETIIKALLGLKDIDLELIEQTPYLECVARRSRCHVTIEQFRFGYGNSGIEAWAMRQPTIGGIMWEKFYAPYRTRSGYNYPFIFCSENVEEIRNTVERLTDDKDFYAEYVQKGVDRFYKYHHAPVVADTAIKLYKRAMDMRGKQNYAPVRKSMETMEIPNINLSHSLNILSLGQWDYAGSGYFLAQAINDTTEHHCRAVRMEESLLCFPYDLMRPNWKQLEVLWNWADVIHLHDAFSAADRLTAISRKPIVITYHGTKYRRSPDGFSASAKKFGWLATVATPDLTIYGLPWLPDCRPDLSNYVKRSGMFSISHSPTKRHIKGTNAVLEALVGLDVKLILVEKKPWQQCLRKKGQAHVAIDQFKLGYGCNAIEAWSMGQAVISGGTAEVMQAVQDCVGYIPFYECSQNPADIRQAIIELQNPDIQKETAEFGIQCYQDNHSPEAAAQIALGFYAKALLMPLPVVGAPASAKPKKKRRKKGDLIPGDGDIRLLQYVGRSTQDQTFWGPATRRKYAFSGTERVKYVYAPDVAGMLGMKTKAGKPLFKEV